MPKNIVLCCDGTGNQFGVDKTNVLRLHRSLVIDPERQVAFYSPGVGTFSPSMALTQPGQAINKVLGLALGWGYRATIENAYQFIVENYREGDRIFLFGFSRGAYTARIVAAMVHALGILQPGNRQLIQYALAEIEVRGGQKVNFDLLREFKAQFSQSISKPFLFLGVWDTVSSVSWAYDYLRYLFTANNRSVDVIRHAVSIDEHRSFFAQNLFTQRPKQDVKEVWFAGVHSDIGGGYRENESELSKITLEWMLREARDVDGGGLLLDDTKVADDLLGEHGPDYRGKLHRSLTWKWWLAEFFPKQNFYWRIPLPHLFRKRRMITRSPGKKASPPVRIHESVKRRLDDKSLHYAPSHLAKEYDIEPRVPYLAD